MSVKSSDDIIGNRNRELTSCSALPRPTAPPSSMATLMHFIVPLWHKSAIGRTSQHTGLVNRFRSRNQQNQYLGGVNEDEMKLTPVVSSNLILTTSPFHRPVRRIKLAQAVPPSTFIQEVSGSHL